METHDLIFTFCVWFLGMQKVTLFDLIINQFMDWIRKHFGSMSHFLQSLTCQIVAMAWSSWNWNQHRSGGWWQSPAATTAWSSWSQERRPQNPQQQSTQFPPHETIYSSWPMNKQDFDRDGQDSFQACKEVAESLGCVLKLRGRATRDRPDRAVFLTIQGLQRFAVYDMLISVAKRRGHDMSKVLLPHEGAMRRLATWQEEQAQQARFETNETVDNAGDHEQELQADANKPAPEMEPLPPDDDDNDDYDDSVPDWGEAPDEDQERVVIRLVPALALEQEPVRLQSVQREETISDNVRLQSVPREEPGDSVRLQSVQREEPVSDGVRLQSVQREEAVRLQSVQREEAVRLQSVTPRREEPARLQSVQREEPVSDRVRLQSVPRHAHRRDEEPVSDARREEPPVMPKPPVPVTVSEAMPQAKRASSSSGSMIQSLLALPPPKNSMELRRRRRRRKTR